MEHACFIRYDRAEAVALKLSRDNPSVTRVQVQQHFSRGAITGYRIRYSKGGRSEFVTEDML